MGEAKNEKYFCW